MCSQQVYYAPINYARPSSRNPCTYLHGSLVIYRPLRDGWLSWPCWLTDSGRLNHLVVTHPASSLAQDRESSPAQTSVLTMHCAIRCQPFFRMLMLPAWLGLTSTLAADHKRLDKIIFQTLYNEVFCAPDAPIDTLIITADEALVRQDAKY